MNMLQLVPYAFGSRFFKYMGLLLAFTVFLKPVLGRAADVCTTASTTLNAGNPVSGANNCDLDAGESVQIDSDGSINTTEISAIVVQFGNVGGNISIDGSVSTTAASGRLVLVAGDVGDVTNTGTLTSTFTALQLGFGAQISVGDVLNSGTIDGDDPGGSVGVGLLIGSVSTIGTVTNTGTIRGDRAVFATSQATIITSGTISNPDPSVALITFSGGADLIIEDGAIFSGGNINVQSGSTLDIRGGYTTDASQVFSTFDSITIENTGALQVSVNSDGSQYNRYLAGTVTFDPGAGINVDVPVTNTLSDGDTLSGVVNATTFNGVDGLAVTDNSALLDFTAVLNGNDLDLQIAADSSGSGNTGVLISLDRAGEQSGRGAARVLDELRLQQSLSGDMATVIAAFNALPTDKDVASATQQTLPLLTGNLRQTSIKAMKTGHRIVQARQQRLTGFSFGEQVDEKGREFWIKPFAARADQNERNDVEGYEADTFGLVLGADHAWDDESRYGWALSASQSDITSDRGTSSAQVNSYQVIGYGSHILDEQSEFNFQLGMGYNLNEGTRSITFSGLNRHASSEYSSWSAHFGGRFSKNFDLSDQMSLVASIGTDFTYIRDDAYKETGADSLNLDVDSSDSKELLIMAESVLSLSLDNDTTLTSSLGLGYDMLRNKNSITAAYVGGGSVFTTEGIEPSSWTLRAGIGIAMKIWETIELTARYDLESRERYLNQSASVNLRWPF